MATDRGVPRRTPCCTLARRPTNGAAASGPRTRRPTRGACSRPARTLRLSDAGRERTPRTPEAEALGRSRWWWVGALTLPLARACRLPCADAAYAAVFYCVPSGACSVCGGSAPYVGLGACRCCKAVQVSAGRGAPMLVYQGRSIKFLVVKHEVACLFSQPCLYIRVKCWNPQLVTDGIDAKASTCTLLFCSRGHDTSCLPAATGSRCQGTYRDVRRDCITECQEPSGHLHVQLQMTLLCFALQNFSRATKQQEQYCINESSNSKRSTSRLALVLSLCANHHDWLWSSRLALVLSLCAYAEGGVGAVTSALARFDVHILHSLVGYSLPTWLPSRTGISFCNKAKTWRRACAPPQHCCCCTVVCSMHVILRCCKSKRICVNASTDTSIAQHGHVILNVVPPRSRRTRRASRA